MNNLIPINYDNPERPTVSGRELHEFLKIETPYAKWFGRMTEYGFTEGENFATVDKNVLRADGTQMPQIQHDHQLTIPMAKELCMIQRNERGKQARQYFLAVEAQWNSPEAVMRRAVLIADRKVKELTTANKTLLAENNELRSDAEYARTVCIGDNCRTATDIAKDYGFTSASKLNNILYGLRIQYKTSDGQWVLYSRYCGKGYTKNRKGKPFQHNSGRITTPNTTVWTEEGQRFLYEKLKSIGLTPVVEPRDKEGGSADFPCRICIVGQRILSARGGTWSMKTHDPTSHPDGRSGCRVDLLLWVSPLRKRITGNPQQGCFLTGNHGHMGRVDSEFAL